MSIHEIFLFAHGCFLDQSMPRNPNLSFYFDTAENTCSQGDFTSPSWNKSDYTYPMTKKMEYNLHFYDELSEIAGFNSLGVYVKQGETIRKIPLPTMEWKMSQLIDYLTHMQIIYANNRTNVYCRICRVPCTGNYINNGGYFDDGRWSVKRRRRMSKKHGRRLRKSCRRPRNSKTNHK